VAEIPFFLPERPGLTLICLSDPRRPIETTLRAMGLDIALLKKQET
jgi:hypothetical protein